MNPQNLKTLIFAIVAFVFAGFAFAQQPDDCTLRFAGHYRAALKQRQAGLPYQEYNNGEPIDLNQWFRLTEKLSAQLGTSGSTVPQDQIIKNVEDIQVTLKGYLLAVRFEKNVSQGDGKDNEFHIEIGATPQWEGPHVVVEVTTGQPSCAARKKAWSLAVADALSDPATKSKKKQMTLRVFANPIPVLITGYVFVDGTHAHGAMTPMKWAHDSGGRGIQVNGLASQVNGLFEIHPVTVLTTTGQ